MVWAVRTPERPRGMLSVTREPNTSSRGYCTCSPALCGVNWPIANFTLWEQLFVMVQVTVSRWLDARILKLLLGKVGLGLLYLQLPGVAPSIKLTATAWSVGL